MKTISVIRAVFALLLLAALSLPQIACVKHTATTKVSGISVQQDPLISSLTVTFTALPFTATLWNSYVDSYYKDKRITKAEAQEFTRWSKNVSQLSKDVLAELRSEHPREVKLLAVAKILNDYQKPTILSTMSPDAKAAYRAITAVMDAVIDQLKEPE